jgi:pimeloyl-ACP methyl ester carboxylesterase
MWEPFLRLTGGIAPDLPGFGESAKPAGYPYDIDGLADHLEALLDHLRVDQFSLVVHDWGTVGRALARRHPKRVERLVILDAVPLLPGYRWHWPARAWRTPGLGELAMLFTRKPTLRLFSREAAATPGRCRRTGSTGSGRTSTVVRSGRSCGSTGTRRRTYSRPPAPGSASSPLRRW